MNNIEQKSGILCRFGVIHAPLFTFDTLELRRKGCPISEYDDSAFAEF